MENNKNGKTDVQELERLFRKYNNNLVISGVGIIFFGLWTVLKVLAITFLNGIDLSTYEIDSEDDKIVFFIVFFTMIILVSALIFFIHYYVGHCAIITGRQKKIKRFYLIIVFILLLTTIWGLPYYFTVLDNPPEVSSSNVADTSIASIFVDLAFCIALFDLMYSSFRLRQIKKQLWRK